MIKNITSKQQRVLKYYEDYIKKNGFAPTYQQAGNDLELSPSVVFSHIKNLDKKGYLISSGKEKSVQILSDSQNIPLIGDIACGEPISVYEYCNDYIDVPKTMLKGGGSFYGLKAVGRSMINAGINSGDFLIIRKQDDVDNGDIGVVVMGEYIDEEKATLKKVFHNGKELILKPENDSFPVTVIKSGEVRGKLVGVLRNY
ncbi:MAG: transcriptional repressor LexA [Candidatus Gracilibacteria bacterium]|nr:transcriptional repressor LexA [Candidatus Gracilibacteria bacterium]MDD4530938.1 transcriptional repressor LexA [Candidatus Gracilibacteria bacterium]